MQFKPNLAANRGRLRENGTVSVNLETHYPIIGLVDVLFKLFNNLIYVKGRICDINRITLKGRMDSDRQNNCVTVSMCGLEYYLRLQLAFNS